MQAVLERMNPPINLECDKVFRHRRSVIILDDVLVVTYNTNIPYPQQTNANVERYSIRRLHLPSYESNNVPYLCATPAKLDLSGPFLQVLRQTDHHFPIVQTSGRYRLDPRLAEEWKELEKFLDNISQILVFRGQTIISLDYKIPPLPSKYGYSDAHETRHAAIVAAQRSRDAFQALMAHVSWGMILHRWRSITSKVSALNESGGNVTLQSAIEQDKTLDAGWMQILQGCNIHAGWLHGLETSILSDFSIARAGVVIRCPLDWMYTRMLPALIHANIPVWIIWGNISAPTESVRWSAELKKAYGPTQFERAHAHKWVADPKAGSRHISPPPPSVIVHEEPPTPCNKETINTSNGGPATDTAHTRSMDTVNTTSASSNKGMDIREWIQMRKAGIETAKAKASPKALQAMQQRQKASEKFAIPGKKGATVYEWERDHLNRPIRTLVTRANVEQVWCCYGDKQRWYNCAKDEWELCEELDPSDKALDNEEFWDDSDDGTMPTRNGWRAPEGHGTDTPYNQLPEEDELNSELNVELEGWRKKPDVDHVYDMQFAFSSESPWLNSQDMQDDTSSAHSTCSSPAMHMISDRYGFAYSNRGPYPVVQKTQWTFAKAMRVIGDSKEKQTFTLPDGIHAAAIQFIMHLDVIGRTESTVNTFPYNLCDLYEENALYLGRIESPLFVQRIQSNGKNLYIIHHRNDIDRQWLLAVADPCTALQAIRTHAPSLDSLTLTFIHAKVAFNTLQRAESGQILGLREQRKRRRRIGLGKRPVGHVLDKSDYTVYEAQKRQLLELDRVARAAIKRGGILARLCEGTVDDCSILSGPSSDAHELPLQVIIDIEGEQVTFYDDDISVEEMAILVGLYIIQPDNKSALAEHSWWPTTDKFEESGLNVGVWSPKCEEWFQSRKRNIVEGIQGTLTAKSWRAYLRYETETKRVYKGAKGIAATYIERSLTEDTRNG